MQPQVPPQTNPCKAAALEYLKLGFSIIPIRPKDKKPPKGFRWKQFQKRQATPVEVEDWFRKWPDANIALVTGLISGVAVVDGDGEEGVAWMEANLPRTSVYQKTGKGRHAIFATNGEPIQNAVRITKGVDIRGDGGYVVIAPSTHSSGKQYELVFPEGREGWDSLTPWPHSQLLNSYSSAFKGGEGGRGKPPKNAKTKTDFKRLQTTLDDFKEGNRDNALFHLATHLVKGGMLPDEIYNYLNIVAKNCDPPFPEKEIPVKIRSALQRAEQKKINIAEEVREFVMTSSGSFLTSDVSGRLQVTSRSEKKAVTSELLRLHGKGIIERYGNRNGCYRRVEKQCEPLDFQNAPTESVDIVLPFDLHNMVEIMPGNIILVSGEPNAGKTGFLLNVIRMNMGKFTVHYFNSEMGGGELRKRLSKFDMPLDAWTFKAWERSANFADAIKPGQGVINIIDYLEIHDNFYEVSGRLAEIHEKLNGAVAVVALQKNKGTDIGLGGFRNLEKPRLALAMSAGTLKIVKAKNWATSENPNGLQVEFKIIQGCKFKKLGDWHRET